MAIERKFNFFLLENLMVIVVEMAMVGGRDGGDDSVVKLTYFSFRTFSKQNYADQRVEFRT